MVCSNLLCKLYGVKSVMLKSIIRKILYKFEGGYFYSTTLRRIMKDYYKVEIGMYSHGECFTPGATEQYTTIGRYCSIARGVRIITINHPMEFKSTHALFFHPDNEKDKKDLREWSPITIGNDVWIGHGAIILPNVNYVGDGAVISAGAVVNIDVPPYAVVVGNPARIVRYRFSKEMINELLESKWWEKDIEEIKAHLQEYQKPYEKLYSERKNADLEA